MLLPDFTARDFSVNLWLTGGPVFILTRTWKIFRDNDAPLHLNARLAPRCEFHTFRELPQTKRTMATFVRKGTNLFWYVNGVLDNEDHGIDDYHLPADRDVRCAGSFSVVEHALAPSEIKTLLSSRWPT